MAEKDSDDQNERQRDVVFRAKRPKITHTTKSSASSEQNVKADSANTQHVFPASSKDSSMQPIMYQPPPWSPNPAMMFPNNGGHLGVVSQAEHLGMMLPYTCAGTYPSVPIPHMASVPNYAQSQPRLLHGASDASALAAAAAIAGMAGNSHVMQHPQGFHPSYFGCWAMHPLAGSAPFCGPPMMMNQMMHQAMPSQQHPILSSADMSMFRNGRMLIDPTFAETNPKNSASDPLPQKLAASIYPSNRQSLTPEVVETVANSSDSVLFAIRTWKSKLQGITSDTYVTHDLQNLLRDLSKASKRLSKLCSCYFF